MLTLFIEQLPHLRILDIIDIVLVAYLFYELYKLIKGTAAINIFIGIISIYLMWKLVRILEMELLTEILGQFISVGVIALIVVFQPEIRRFLLLLGTPGFISKKSKRFLFWRIYMGNESSLNIDPIIQACQKMSQSKTGALLVIANKNELQTFVNTGDLIEANISMQLLENIFFKNSPLHDGAVIIVNNRIRAARCILPVSGNRNISHDLGLRHRSAMGITEQSDAIAIVVSEQSGKISYCKKGELTLDIQPSQLKDFLDEEFNVIS
ncbi:MAG: diadenylate cyclase CdaA [Bacteroidetes bacterium]|nr:diadenylate cyclase CdaA [Bacteroidota bacterium]